MVNERTFQTIICYKYRGKNPNLNINKYNKEKYAYINYDKV